jgi:hypothetical protein
MMHVSRWPFNGTVVIERKAIRIIREQNICEQDCVQVTWKRRELYVCTTDPLLPAFPITEDVLKELRDNTL